MRRRANGEGSVRQRRPRLWEGRYYASDGRQRSVYARTRTEVLAKLRAAIADASSGLRPAPARLTVGAWLDEWLSSVRPRLRPATVASYELVVERYLRPALGNVPLAKLSAEHVGTLLVRLRDDGRLSPTSVRYVYAVLRIALGRAVKAGKVTRNVATLVDPPARARVELQPLRRDQVVRLIEATADHPLGPLFATALGTGLRQGELLALTWADVDLEGRHLTVRRALDRRTRRLADTKTERSRRTVPLPAFVVAALREQRRRQNEARLRAGSAWEDHDLVFANRTGRPLDPRAVTRAYQRVLADLGLPRQRFHDTRHVFATLQLEAGEDLAIVSKLLGHADLATTANVYGHLTRGMGDRAAERLDAIVRSGA